jgi:phosphosulfolactate synthase
MNDALAAREPTLTETLRLSIPTRTAKPRQRGLTMVMDQGSPVGFVADVLADFGEYLDIVKLWDPLLRAPSKQVEKRIAVYREHDVLVQPGGIWLEMASRQGPVDDVLTKLDALGFNAIEVSNTTSTHALVSEEAALVKKAHERGFRVFGEVGQKFADGDQTRITEDLINVERTVAEFQALLDAGAWKVYWEGHLLRMVLGDDPEAIKERAHSGVQQVREVIQRIGADNIMFEVSGLRPRANRQWLQFWLVRLLGSEVNLANARIDEMGNLEAIRMGTHPIFGLGSSGNYSIMRETQAADGGVPGLLA